MAAIVTIADDFDHDVPADEKIIFAVGNVVYEIDLCETNAAEFRELLQPYIDAAHKQGARLRLRPEGPTPSGRSAPAAAVAGDGERPWYRNDPDDDPATRKAKHTYRMAVRGWAQAEPSQPNLGARGIIPDGCFDAYEQWLADSGQPNGPRAAGIA